jgi:hypothetical protein
MHVHCQVMNKKNDSDFFTCLAASIYVDRIERNPIGPSVVIQWDL